MLSAGCSIYDDTRAAGSSPAPDPRASSGWAANALSWAVANGIFKDMPYDAATGTATRAQTAQMLMNFLEK